MNYPKYRNMGWVPRVHKMNNGRNTKVPTTKTDSKVQDTRIKEAEVKNWWNARVNERRVFKVTQDTMEEGYDYVGTLPWPDFVSLTALHVDFQSSTGITMARLRFAHMWHKASGIPRGKSRNYRVKTLDGVPLYYKNNTFYDISAL